jgi:hypothetical protein
MQTRWQWDAKQTDVSSDGRYRLVIDPGVPPIVKWHLKQEHAITIGV